MAIKLKFTHSAKSAGSKYTTLDMRIALAHDDNPHTDRIVSLHWQRTNSELEHGWYAFSLKIETRDISDFEHCVKIVRKLKGKDSLHLGTYTRPQDVLDRLQSLGAIECVYDRRLGEWVSIGNAKPAEYKAWRDAHKHSCTVGCLARDEREAQAGIMTEFSKFASASTYGAYDNDLAEWILAGKPVRQIPDWTAGSPDLTPFYERIAA